MASVWIWIIVLLAIGIVCAVVLRSPVSVQLEYHHHKDEDEGKVECRALWNLIRVRRKLIGVEVTPAVEGPALKVHHASGGQGQPKEKKTSAFSLHEIWSLRERFKEWWRFLQRCRPTLKQLARHMTLERFQVRAVVGTGDAVSTAILCGAAWSTCSAVTGWVYSQVGHAAKPDIQVSPLYQGSSWAVDFNCIVRVRVGHAIVAAFQLIRLWRRRASRGTPHSRVNAYRHVEYP